MTPPPIVKGVPFTVSANVTLPVTPPVAYLPSSAGVPLPAGLSGFRLDFDMVNVPAGQTLAFGVEFQYQNPRTTPPVPLDWYPLVAASFLGGPMVTIKGGLPTTVAGIISSINPYNDYPQAVRARVDKSGAWLIPTVVVTFF